MRTRSNPDPTILLGVIAVAVAAYAVLRKRPETPAPAPASAGVPRQPSISPITLAAGVNPALILSAGSNARLYAEMLNRLQSQAAARAAVNRASSSGDGMMNTAGINGLGCWGRKCGCS